MPGRRGHVELAFGPDDPEKKEICTPTKSTLKSGDELIQLDKEQTAGDESHEEEPSFFRTLVSQEKSIDTLEFEVAEYMRTQTGKKFVDPYHWWKSKGENQFPQLAQLALTYLAIPGWNTVVHNQQLFEGSAVLRASAATDGTRWWLCARRARRRKAPRW